MAEHAGRQGPHALPLELLVHELAVARQRAAVNVENEDFFAQLLVVARLAGQAVHVAVFVGKGGGIDGVQDGAVEGLDDGFHRHVAFGERAIARVCVSARRLSEREKKTERRPVGAC